MKKYMAVFPYKVCLIDQSEEGRLGCHDVYIIMHHERVMRYISFYLLSVIYHIKDIISHITIGHQRLASQWSYSSMKQLRVLFKFSTSKYTKTQFEKPTIGKHHRAKSLLFVLLAACCPSVCYVAHHMHAQYKLSRIVGKV